MFGHTGGEKSGPVPGTVILVFAAAFGIEALPAAGPHSVWTGALAAFPRHCSALAISVVRYACALAA
jgi:hypothetical protein